MFFNSSRTSLRPFNSLLKALTSFSYFEALFYMSALSNDDDF